MAKSRFKKTQSTWSPDPIESRAFQVRRDNDKVSYRGVRLYDVDYAVYAHIKNYLALPIAQNNTTIEIPVGFANGEHWSQIQAHGYMRDSGGMLMAPLIMINRTGFQTRDDVPQLDVNRSPDNVPGRTGGSSIILKKAYTSANRYDRFNITNNKKPSQEFYALATPEYIEVSYDVLIWTEYQEQMNGLVEQFQFHDGFAWGDTYKFQCNLDGVSFNIINAPGEDRLVRATIPVRAKAAISVPFEDFRSAIDKRISVKRVVFGDEQISFDTPNNPNDQITNTGDSFKKLL
ncbi:MAG: hypothetical protein ACOVRN_14255 [Flavobacterium sp.]